MGIDEALCGIEDGALLMVGGFLGCGSPSILVDRLLERGIKDLTLISNDAARPEVGVGRLIVAQRVKKLIATHIGTNPEAGRQLGAGTLQVELVPQGTFAERIRAGGAGLGGVITPTGVGTLVEEGKRKIEISGRTYLIELPLRAQVALIFANRADRMGNLQLFGTTKNSNMVMATAADLVIAQVEEIVEVGEISPDQVSIPGVYVDRLVEGVRA